MATWQLQYQKKIIQRRREDLNRHSNRGEAPFCLAGKKKPSSNRSAGVGVGLFFWPVIYRSLPRETPGRKHQAYFHPLSFQSIVRHTAQGESVREERPQVFGAKTVVI
ncbi:hypothetical protein AWENTII_001161 [Aspergillus wentii]